MWTPRWHSWSVTPVYPLLQMSVLCCPKGFFFTCGSLVFKRLYFNKAMKFSFCWPVNSSEHYIAIDLSRDLMHVYNSSSTPRCVVRPCISRKCKCSCAASSLWDESRLHLSSQYWVKEGFLLLSSSTWSVIRLFRNKIFLSLWLKSLVWI